MTPLRRIAAFTLIASLMGLSGCIWPYGGQGGRGEGEHMQRRGENQGGQGRREAGCGGDHRRDDCNDQGHQ